MKIPLLFVILLTGILTKSFCQISIGKYSAGSVFTNETLELFENNKFEYSASSCDGGIYGRGEYEVDAELLCLYFKGPQTKLKESKITKIGSSKDSVIIYFTDKFKKLMWLEFSCFTKNYAVMDTAIKLSINCSLKFPKSCLPIKLNFNNLELERGRMNFKKPGVFWVEISGNRQNIAEKLNYKMLFNTTVVYQYKLGNNSLELSDLTRKYTTILTQQ